VLRRIWLAGRNAGMRRDGKHDTGLCRKTYRVPVPRAPSNAALHHKPNAIW
jgi:hypothetical protein